MAKPRVHEIAKEIGKTSKELLSWLGENGEYVRGPSSTLEAPVVRRVREAFAAKADAPAEEKQSKPAPKAPAKKAEPAGETKTDLPVATPGAPDPSALRAPATTPSPPRRAWARSSVVGPAPTAHLAARAALLVPVAPVVSRRCRAPVARAACPACRAPTRR